MAGELEEGETGTRWKAWLSASWRRWTLRVLGTVLTLVLLLGVMVDTSFGHRLVANYISGLQPASGLRVEIGEITGSLYGKAQLHGLALSDPQGEFLQVPLTELDWRPLRWFTYGLDIRQLSFRQGTLSRFPEFEPGDPDSALLPGFNIRVDQFEIDQLEIAEGLAGERREISLLAQARVDDGIVQLGVDGDLGGTDRLLVQLEAQPDADRFALDLEYNAPAGGLLAGLTGADEDWHAGISGEGGWSAWDGQLAVQRADEELAAFGLSNRSGQYQAQGQFRPYGELEPVVERAAGDVVALDLGGTFKDSTFDGEVTLASNALQIQGDGSIDFSDNRFDGFAIALTLLDPRLFGEEVLLEGAHATATIDGRFSRLRIDHQLNISRLGLQSAVFEQVSQQGVARREEDGWNVDLDADILRSRTGLEDADRVLARSQVDGLLQLRGSTLQSDRLELVSPVLAAQVALDADLLRADYALSGRAEVNRLDMPDLARIDASVDFAFTLGGESPWNLNAEYSGRASNIAIHLADQLAGSELTFGGMLSAGDGQPIVLADASLSGELLELAFDAEVDGDQLAFSGTGEHVSYGPLRFAASRQGEESKADLTLDSPFAPAGLEDVSIALASMDGGFSIETRGHSRFGPFDGQLRLLLPEEQAPRIAVDRFDIWRTSLSGQMVIEDGLVLGELNLAGGGVEGVVELLRSSDDAQGYRADLTASNARFGGATELSVADAHLVAEGDFVSDDSKMRGTFDAQGVGYGEFFIGRLAGQADLNGGEGRAALLLVGRNESDFELQLESRIQPDRAIVEVRGRYLGEPITMPRPATITWEGEGAWRVAPFQLNFDGGLFRAEAQADQDGSMRGRVQLDDMPISEIGMIRPDTGLTGIATGSLAWSVPANGAPRAAMDVELVDFSRSGLTLSSRPVDIEANASLSENQLRVSARASEDEAEIGRLNLRIADLPATGSLLERLYGGQLGGNVQYDGPASSIWRLAQLDTFDVTGPLSVRATFSGRPSTPRVSGSLQGDGMRLNSGTTGTDITDISLRGRFMGSNLELTSFSGTTSGNGTVSGSGTVGFADLLEHGPTIDLRIAARQAQLLGRSDIAATLTGPMRIVSDGSGGTIAGRVRVDRGYWRLGQADEAEAIPVIETMEINLPSSRAPANPRHGSWAYMIDAQATNQLEVEGLGLDSEWSADIRLRGTVEDPRIGGRAELVRGEFVFGGTTFELERGDIRFDEAIEPDPVLDIVANSQIDELDVFITVTGKATAPQIDLRSTPRLPEDELLSRILFGGPLNELSPLSALQMGSALASLRSGGGLRPINGLRQAAGLSHLRLLAPDPSIDRGTAVAAGRYFTRRVYVELVTDGQGYTATQLEFRLTSWLQLLASTSSLNRERVTLEYRKDY